MNPASEGLTGDLAGAEPAVRPVEEFDYDERYQLPMHWILDPHARTGIDYFDYIGQVLDLIPGSGPLRVLDAGCGDGYVSSLLAGRGHRVVGADASSSAVGFSRVLVPAARFVETDLRELDRAALGEDGFDAAILIEVLEHIPVADQARVLESLHGVIEPGGHIYVTLPSVDLPLIPWHYKHYTDEEATALLSAAGFEVEVISRQFRLTPVSRALFVRGRWWRLIENRIYDLRFARRLMTRLFARRYSVAPGTKPAGRIIARARAI